jgi:hypothetical protein
MNNKKGMVAAIFFLLFLIQVPGYAQTIMYVPFDNRPVSYEYVIDTVKKGGFDILVPPEGDLAARTRSANPDQLWEWVFAHAKEADGVVVSADTLIYGGLVASRTHEISEEVLLQRTANFKKLKELNPSLRLYVFSTIMRSPHASSGGVEPAYYETYGPAIFRIHALNIDWYHLLHPCRKKRKAHNVQSLCAPQSIVTTVPSHLPQTSGSKERMPLLFPKEFPLRFPWRIFADAL